MEGRDSRNRITLLLASLKLNSRISVVMLLEFMLRTAILKGDQYGRK